MNFFRKSHLITFLRERERQRPVDRALHGYFRSHRSIGAHDRREIAEVAYAMVRWAGLLDHTMSDGESVEERVDRYLRLDREHYFSKSRLQDCALPPHLRVSFPHILFNLFEQEYGQERALELGWILNQRAPRTIRANLLKTTRSELLVLLRQHGRFTPCQKVETGIVAEDRVNLFELPEFQEGFFEMQDEGSQLVAEQVKAEAGDHLVDFCAGSGGKSLAIAPRMNGKGQIYLYDVRERVLHEAKRRLKRAGVQNGQLVTRKKLTKKGLRGRMDWILFDLPCSGSGTLRRHVDMKWRLGAEEIEALCQQQREIVSEGLPLLQARGKIVYVTCSILKRENDDQIAYLQSQHNLKLCAPSLQTFPEEGGMDGFFCAVLEKRA